MKIEEAIEKLQKIQKLCPGIDITDGSAALYYIDVLPAYYDGCYTRLKQDKSRSDEYNIVGAKMISEGHKCVLHFMGARTLCWEDQTIENPDFFEYDDGAEKKEKRFIDEELLKAKNFNEEIREKMQKNVSAKILRPAKEGKITFADAVRAVKKVLRNKEDKSEEK